MAAAQAPLIPLSDIRKTGRDLRRPESVLCTASGDIFTSHLSHGVARITPDGRQLLLAPPTEHLGLPIIPNGIALRQDGSFLVANISDTGGLLELDSDGVRLFNDCSTTGKAPPVNFVCVDQLDRIWFTVSSTMSPRALAYRRDVKNGYIGIIDPDGVRIVLEGLHYTNEIRPDLEGGWLYISETFGQKVSRVRLDEGGIHGTPATLAQLPRGAFVDGIELDEEGALLAACIVSNELFRIMPDGSYSLLVGERDPGWVETVEAALDHGQMGRPHFDASPGTTLKNISSVAFAGKDLRQAICGNLLDGSLPHFDVPVPGRKPRHWDVAVPLWGQEF
jgi:sugar lactone lactonase YvrE